MIELFNMNEKIKMAHNICLEEKFDNNYFGTFLKLIIDPSSIISNYHLSKTGTRNVFKYLINNELDIDNTKVAFIVNDDFEYDFNSIEQYSNVDFYLVNTKNDNYHYLFSSVKQN